MVKRQSASADECVIGAVFVLVGGVLTLVTAKYGLNMQDWVDERLKKKKNADPEKQ